MSELTFEQREVLASLLIAHGMDDGHEEHDEIDCRAAVYAQVESIVAAHVREALETAADEVEVAANSIDPFIDDWPEGGMEAACRAAGLRQASRAIRTHKPT